MIIAFVNKKGGTGKTTSTINIGKGLALRGKKVLLLDLDPQSNMTYSLGIKVDNCVFGDCLAKTSIADEDIYEHDNLHVVPSTSDLINYEVEFIRQEYPYSLVKDTLSSVQSNYDYVLLDCPPSASYIMYCALIASDAVVIPMQMDVLSLQGLEQMIESIFEVKEEYNSKLYVLGVLGVLVDSRKHLTHQILELVTNEYGVNIFNNYVRQNVKAAEAPSHGLSVIEYAPKSNSAKDYISVTNEFLTILEN